MKRSAEIVVRPDEFVGAREAARGFSGLVEKLVNGEARRFVILYRNRPRAVLLSMDEYEELLEAMELARERFEAGLDAE